MKRKIEIVVLSDTHLGTYGCHAKELLNYLKSIKPETLILNGDFIDMWNFKKSYFPAEHMKVINRVMKMALNGTKVYYLTGNHDDLLRRFTDFSSGSFHLRDKLELQINGQRHLFFHGDVFDTSVMHNRWLAKLGGQSYDLLIRLNRFINHWRNKMGQPRMSFAAMIKERVKEAVKFINNFEQIAIEMAAAQGYAYVVCGHVHKPQMREVETPSGRVTYLNSGDWVENLTALEYNYGAWTLFQYDELDFDFFNPKLHSKDIAIDEDEEDKISAVKIDLAQQFLNF